MHYYVIQGPWANNTTAFAVMDQLKAPVPEIAGPANEIYPATLFTHHQDAVNALDELPHKIAKKCRILGVTVSELARAAP